MKFALIEAEKANFPIDFMCAQLGVSRSGYYAWRHRKPSKRALDDEELAADIYTVHRESKGRYGSPRILRAPADRERLDRPSVNARIAGA